MEPLFLTLDEASEIHAQQIELYGGSQGRRDPAALESAIATPMATFGGQFLHSTIPAMAAAYLFHICQNHPFVDGNKRTGANARHRLLTHEQLGSGPQGGRTGRSGPFRGFRNGLETRVNADF